MRSIMKRWRNAELSVKITQWRTQKGAACAERAATKAVSDALGMTSALEKKELKAAEQEASKIRELLKNASGDEALQLMDQLKAAEASAESARQQMGLKIMGYVGKRWRNAGVIRALTSWKILMATWVEETKAAQMAAEGFAQEKGLGDRS